MPAQPIPVFNAPVNVPVYAAAFGAPAAIAVSAAATDVVTISGVAGRKITVLRIVLAGTATAAASALVSLIKRTTLNTGGTPAAVSPVLLNPYPFAGSLVVPSTNAVVTTYTANPGALGTATAPSGGPVASGIMALGTTAAPAPAPQYEAPVSLSLSGSIPLWLPTDLLAVNLNSQTFAGFGLTGTIFFTDEAFS